ncbi:MAG: CHC2 zinc finger domain-containing protein [Nitrospirota bacterium]
MARVSDEELARLKAEVSVQRLVEVRGIELKRHGADWIGRCPFHADKTPSLVVSPAKNLWHCLGACQTGGSVIDWVMKAEGVSFKHAVELLRHELPLSSVPLERVTKKSTAPKLPSPLAANGDDQALLRQVVDYYHETLLHSPEALAYLASRGLNDRALIETFRLGYSNRTLGYRLPHKNRVDGAVLRGKLQQLGIYRASGHEHFVGSLVVPVLGADGTVTELYGRKVGERLRDGTVYHLYLPGPHVGVWNAAGLAGCEEVILCEALLDAMTFWCAGYRHVTASYGVEGFTADHLALFKTNGVKRVLIAYDRDEAGDRAAAGVAQKLLAEGFDCYRVLFPKGMDANAYACKVGPAQKSLGLVLRKAEWLGKGAAPALSVVHVAVAVEPVQAVEAGAPTEADSLAAKTENPGAVVDAPELPPLAAALPVLPATPAATVVAPVLEAQTKDGDVLLTFGDRQYRVRGHERNSTPEQLRITLRAARGSAFHVDTLDLYSAKARAAYIKQAGLELGASEDAIKSDLGLVLLHLESLHDAKLQAQMKPDASAAPVLASEEHAEAMALLRAPDLLGRVLEDFARCGVVGEETNKLVGYLACVSRKLDRPLAVIIQSSSAAGKSSLMDAILQLIPEEERVQYSAMTGQSLFYMGETNLKHKILAIAEEEGATRASYALKLLQSDGSLTIASTGKDPVTGNLITQEYRVEGPVMIFLTTTAIDIDEELLNRCLVLTVNESREQTRAIHVQQRARRTLAGLQAKVERAAVIRAHENAQRLLRPLAVINPYADQLTFLDSKTRTRRDHEKYLSLIDSIALLHQHQRPVRTLQHAGQTLEYVEVTLADIATANALAHEVLGRTLDELPPQTRSLLRAIADLAHERGRAQGLKQAAVRFSRKDVRDHTGWGETQLRVHLERLAQMEYLLVHRGGRGQSFVYELVWDAQAEISDAHLPGLLDVAALQSAPTTQSSRGEVDEFAGLSRPLRGASSGTSPVAENPELRGKMPPFLVADAVAPENAPPVPKRVNGTTYPQAVG